MRFANMTTIKAFTKKEFSQVLRDPKMRVILIVLPLIQMMVFGFAITTEVKNIKLECIYQPNDIIFRHIEKRAFSSKWFIPAPKNQSSSSPYEQILSGKTDVIILGPPGGITKSIEQKKGEIQVLIDATNVIKAQNIERYISSILSEVLRDDFHLSTPPSLTFDVRILYNPAMESAIFMVPGTMAMILCIVTILLTSMSIAKEKELGTFEMIISAPIKTWEIILGKTIPFIIIGMINAFTIYMLAFIVFKVPMRGHFLHLFLSSFSFIITTVSIGTLISTFAKNQQQAMMGGFIFLFLSNLMSGVMFPIDNMPTIMKFIAYLNPMTYFVKLLRNIMLKGGAPELVYTYVSILLLMAFLTTIISFKRFKHTL